MDNSSRAEVLALCRGEDDLAALGRAAEACGVALGTVGSPVELARQTVARRPVAVFVGVGTRSLANLDVIPVIRAVRSDLPVIVLAEEDSLEIERQARQQAIFYYLVHPIEAQEVEAVLKDVLRRAAG
ncbi:MAG: hypothetical protein ACE5JH_03220 [Acidobacteriota bacterium]